MKYYALEQQAIGQTQHSFPTRQACDRFLRCTPRAQRLTAREAAKKSHGVHTRYQQHAS